MSYRNQKILIVGSGRWAFEILNEIKKVIKRNRKIYIFDNKKKYINLFVKKYNLLKLSSIQEIKNEKITHVIICNASKDHYKFFFKVKKFKVKILIEKPISINKINNQNIYEYSLKNKAKIFFGSQFYFSNFFKSINKHLVKIKFEPAEMEFIWHDKKKEIRNNFVKRQNLDVKFEEDVFYHFFSIFNSIVKKSNKKLIKNLLYKDNKIFFNLNDILIKFNVSRNSKTRTRKIILKKNKEKNLFYINFSNIPYFKYLKYKKNFGKKDKCLIRQLESFLGIKNKFLSNKIKLEKNKNLILNLKKISK